MTDTTSPTAPAVEFVPSDTKLSYQDWETTLEALGIPPGWQVPKALHYVIANGFTQSMTDAAAFTKEQKQAAHDAAIKAHTESGSTEPHPTIDDVVAGMQRTARNKRFDAIHAGTVAQRVGGTGVAKLSPIDRMMKNIALEAIKAAVAKKGLAMPKGDKLAEFVAKYLAKNDASVRTEAQARLDAAANQADDLDELFA